VLLAVAGGFGLRRSRRTAAAESAGASSGDAESVASAAAARE
jgi:hypothetical protein